MDTLDTARNLLIQQGATEASAKAQVAAASAHSCMGCPNFHLGVRSTEATAYGQQNQAELTTLCALLPDVEYEAGQPVISMRETLQRCPLYGLTSIQALASTIGDLQRRVETLEAQMAEIEFDDPASAEDKAVE